MDKSKDVLDGRVYPLVLPRRAIRDVSVAAETDQFNANSNAVSLPSAVFDPLHHFTDLRSTRVADSLRRQSNVSFTPNVTDFL